MNQRFIALVTSALLIGGALVVAPAQTRAASANVYIGFNAHTTGGSCANPDFTVDGTDDSAQIDLAATATKVGGTLHFCAGTFHMNEQVDFEGRDITLSGVSATKTILDGGATWVDGVYDQGGVLMFTNVKNLTVKKLTLTHGNAAIQTGGDYLDGSVVVMDAVFAYNSGQNGAAISTGGSVSVIRSTFIGNSVEGNGGAIAAEGDITISSSSFTNNTAVGGGGAVGSNNQVIVTKSKFIGNSAANGGAINTESKATVTASTFTRNTATSDGGAINARTKAIIITSTFSRNTSDGYGGAVEAPSGTIRGSKFTKNTAVLNGGAVLFWVPSDVNVKVSTSTFVENRADAGGGAITLGYCETVKLATANKMLKANTFTKNESQGTKNIERLTGFCE
jgi:predicted outer membrane repeat protein